MKRPDDSSASTPETAPAPPPGVAAQAPFRPPVRDPGVLALLEGLNPPIEPVSSPTATTDGELSARFAGEPREPPPGAVTPAPQAKILVAPTPVAGEPAKGKPKSGEKLETTFRLRPSGSPWGVIAAAALLVCVALVALWVRRAPARVGEVAGPPGSPPVPVQTVAETPVYRDIPAPPVAMDPASPPEPVHPNPTSAPRRNPAPPASHAPARQPPEPARSSFPDQP